jgi:putative spermidine/putrescine transport system substrate-binding protein
MTSARSHTDRAIHATDTRAAQGPYDWRATRAPNHQPHTRKETSMKMLFRYGLSVLAAAAIAGAAQAQEAITVVSWGGQYTTSQVKAYHEPFARETGIKVNSVDYNGGLAEIKAQVEAGNVTWDVVDVELSDGIKGCDEGLFEKIDKSILPPAPDGAPAEKDFLPGTLHDCVVATIAFSTIYAYDDSKIGDKKPATVADFFDTKTWPGKRGLRKNPKPTLEMALMADGVPAAQVYQVLSTPEGVDRAFAKLDTIKKDVVWWEAGAQPPQLLADGEVVMTTAYNGRIFGAVANEGKPFTIVWDGQVWELDLWAVPKGTKNKENAMKFIAFSTDTQRLADQAKWIPYGPARQSSMALIGKDASGKFDMKPQMPTAAENLKNATQSNFEFWADNQDQLNERFNAWLARN